MAFALENFGYPKDEIEKRVNYILKYFDLQKYRDKSPFNLSEGEKKRLAIASILVYDPEILVLDEPTTGQDAIQKRKIAEIIKRLSEKGRTIIVVTHDIEFVVELFDRVIVMAEGRIIADGPTREVITNYEIIKRARLLPPQINICARLLEDLGIPSNIITVSELVEEITKVYER